MIKKLLRGFLGTLGRLVRFVDRVTDEQCPVCGYYCLGRGGHGCIDKPNSEIDGKEATFHFPLSTNPNPQGRESTP